MAHAAADSAVAQVGDDYRAEHQSSGEGSAALDYDGGSDGEGTPSPRQLTQQELRTASAAKGKATRAHDEAQARVEAQQAVSDRAHQAAYQLHVAQAGRARIVEGETESVHGETESVHSTGSLAAVRGTRTVAAGQQVRSADQLRAELNVPREKQHSR